MLEISFLGLALWQWLGLALLLGVAFVASWMVASIVRHISRIAAGRTETIVDDHLVDSLYAPFRLLLFVVFSGVGAHLLALSDSADRFLSRLELALVIAAIGAFVVIALRRDLTAAVDRSQKLAVSRVARDFRGLPVGDEAKKLQKEWKQ